jgi:hypothetical protein
VLVVAELPAPPVVVDEPLAPAAPVPLGPGLPVEPLAPPAPPA